MFLPFPYSYITFLIEHTIKDEKLEKDVFYEEIPDSIISVFNENLDFDFTENIEYLLFYNDSLDTIGKDGIAIVKKEENYYLILKEHRNVPAIFFLHSEFESWEIRYLYFNEIDYVFNIETDIDAKVISEKKYHTLDAGGEVHVGRRLYNFKFYNRKFLKLLIQICEQINNECN
ncbi:hypothetical protein Q1W71_23160 [Flavobacterium pectinovorum]|uniref:hypothetical protein n=1 Tax=Flavobacterium pectinovorum TaxID=29533 RepID=UPI00265F7347|nr:hypothetical protein [Flavobacterium pectinovorum]WKL47835.1 hypothetical protein Q1W71_23160 [Flavobacterium pectinovorum]